MIKKYNLFYNFKSQIIIYSALISLIFFFYIYFFCNINGDWRHFIDSEILWPYNVLLVMSGEEIEFSAYGYIYFILEYKFFQILDYLGHLKTSDINELNNSINFSEKLENLILAGRWFNIFIIYSTLLITFLIFCNLTKKITYSFLLLLTFMLSPGMTQQISHARIDILASTLLFISFFYLIKFSDNKKKLQFILFIFFFFLSVLTKVQSYLFLFCLIISALYFVKYDEKKFQKQYFTEDLYIKIFLCLIIFLCIIYPLIFHRHAKFSIIFLYSQLFVLNIFIFYLFKNLKNTIDKNIIYSSIVFLILIFLIISISQISYLTDHVIRLSFLEPMEIRMYLSEANIGEKSLKGMDVITLDIKKNISYFFILFKKITNGFYITSINVFSNLNSNLLLIITNLILILYFVFYKKVLKDSLLLIPVISFFIINGINQIRGQSIELYLTYSEFFLYIPICVYLSRTSKNIKTHIILILLLILTTPLIFNKENYNANRYVKIDRLKDWCPDFLFDYTKKISQKKINEMCF